MNLDTLLLLNSLNGAITILGKSSFEVSDGSAAVWYKLHHASKYLDAQVEELLAPPSEEEVVPNGA